MVPIIGAVVGGIAGLFGGPSQLDKARAMAIGVTLNIILKETFEDALSPTEEEDDDGASKMVAGQLASTVSQNIANGIIGA